LNLVVFDIDGTLTRSSDIDADCFVRAFAEALDLHEIDTEWGAYQHTTDSGIALEIFAARRGRPPTPEELERVQRHFVGLLEREIREGRGPFEPVPGAARAVNALRADPDWAVAVATGSWRASARLKLESARLPVDGLPLATADDARSRAEIVRVARSRSRQLHAVARFDRVVLIGDREWDLRAAAELGCPLVGIAFDGSREVLQRAGAETILDDYLDLERFLRAVRASPVARTRHR
jgi:phosphoglycolate phosphatase-like HAD superfamily hydrolase